MSDQERHRQLQAEAVQHDGDAQRALLAGDEEAAAAAFAGAAATYRASWEVAPPGSFGRLVGYMKASILARDARRERIAAVDVLAIVAADPVAAISPTACWAAAMAALSVRDDARAHAAASVMMVGSPAFARAAVAVDAIADGDVSAYAAAIDEIVADFATREEHLSGVQIADTAVVLDDLAARRGFAARPDSPLVPAY